MAGTVFDTARLKAMDGATYTPVQRVELGLRFLREEIASPTPRPGPPYTDFKTHDYVLARIARKLAECGADASVLANARETAEGELKDCLTLALLLSSQGAGGQGPGAGEKPRSERHAAAGKAGATAKSSARGKPAAKAGRTEPEVQVSPGPRPLTLDPLQAPGPQQELRDEVAAYVRSVKHPLRLRELAAEALGAYAVREQDPSVGPLLAELARRDPHSCYQAGKDGKPTGLLYPVKRAAAQAIERMRKAKLDLPSYVSAAATAPYERPLAPR